MQDVVLVDQPFSQQEIDQLKGNAKDYPRKYELINFNDRHTLLDLIEYTRNASPGYGITNILDNFCKEKFKKLSNHS